MNKTIYHSPYALDLKQGKIVYVAIYWITIKSKIMFYDQKGHSKTDENERIQFNYLTIKRATSTKIKCKYNRIPTKITYTYFITQIFI